MKKAYSMVSNIEKSAVELLESNNIKVVINNSKTKPTDKELICLLMEYDILIIGVENKISKEMLRFIKTPKIIATLSSGLDHIDEEVLYSDIIKVINIKTANALSVAEHIFALILALNKRIYESNSLVIDSKANRQNIHERCEEISNKTLGLIGGGNIAKEVVKIAKAFNMKIKCYTKDVKSSQVLLDYEVEFVTLDNLLKNCDIISVSIPLTAKTKFLISADKILLMKKTATFINTSRRDVVDTNALIEYSKKHSTFYVGLDIDVGDYKDLFSKYRNNVIVTPHTAGSSKQAIGRIDNELASNIVRYLKE